jgi:Zn-dependent metalloprotease
MVQRLGQAKAEKLNYLVLTQYLSSGADFKKARNATVDACAQLYSTADCELVKDAWAAVGL